LASRPSGDEPRLIIAVRNRRSVKPVPVEHRPVRPAHQPHEFAFGAAAVEPVVDEGVPVTTTQIRLTMTSAAPGTGGRQT
jgi:hypothetical protein